MYFKKDENPIMLTIAIMPINKGILSGSSLFGGGGGGGGREGGERGRKGVCFPYLSCPLL